MPNSVSQVVQHVAPLAKDVYLEAVERGGALFQQHGLTTPLRMSHFLAQALHETGGFRVLRESMRYSAARLVEVFGVNRHSAGVTQAEADAIAGDEQKIAERVYGLGNPYKARELGNLQPGDGYRYRGNGVLQTTGRANHRVMGAVCGLDLEGQPELATIAEHALKPALSEWTHNGLNQYADRNDIRTITRLINGGFNGLADREAWLDRVWPLLREGLPDAAWRAGQPDNDVKWLQEALNHLGAQPKLKADGLYGPATRQAVKTFQAAAGLQADGVAGPVTQAAIKLRLDTTRAGVTPPPR